MHSARCASSLCAASCCELSINASTDPRLARGYPALRFHTHDCPAPSGWLWLGGSGVNGLTPPYGHEKRLAVERLGLLRAHTEEVGLRLAHTESELQEQVQPRGNGVRANPCVCVCVCLQEQVQPRGNGVRANPCVCVCVWG